MNKAIAQESISIDTDKMIINLTFLLMYWLVLQDIVLALFLRITDNVTITYIIFFSKDLVMIVLFLLTIFNQKKLRKKTLIFYICFFAVLMVYTFVGLYNGATIMNVGTSIRGWSLFPVFLAVGFSIDLKSPTVRRKLRNFMGFLVFCAVVGIAEVLFDAFIMDTRDFWRYDIGLTRFFTDIKMEEYRLVMGLPGNFYGDFGGPYFSQKRLVSFWAGPLTAGYVLLITLVYYLWLILNDAHKNQHYVYFLIVAIALLMTFTRAIILPVLVLVPFMYFKYRKNIAVLSVLMIFGVALVIFNLGWLGEFLYDGSTIGHIDSFFDGIYQASLFGSGLGTFGIFGDIGTESTYVSLFGQMGIIGFSMYVGLIVYILVLFFKTKTQQPFFRDIILYMSLVFFFTGLISEQMIAFTTIAPFYILLGAGLKLVKDERYSETCEVTFSDSIA